MDLGEYLRNARQNKKMSLRAVEKETGISNPYLSQLESGKIQQPSPTVLHKLAGLFGIDYSTTMRLAGYPVPVAPAASPGGEDSLAARLGPVTDDEAGRLEEYLAFLRSRQKGGRRT